MINFNAPYRRNEFLNFLGNDFLPDDFVETEEKYDSLDFTTRYTVDATKLGTCRSMELDVFEITHTSSHDARVGIAQDAFRLMLHKSYNNRALVVFKQEDGRQYRFSLLQIEALQADNSSRITRSFSNPRRYSFLMGENTHVKTPTQFLMEKGKLTLKDGSYFNDLQERFSVEVLTKLFYKELSDWYFWAVKQVEFPSKPTLAQATEQGKEYDDLVKEHKATNVIRMLTRLLFVWFIKQKGLIPEELFDEDELENNILTELNPIKQTGMFSHTGKDSVYYKAILQNLFFASLNCPVKPQSDDEDKRERGFRRENNDFANDWLFRYRKYFKKPELFVNLINSKVPFLNGGLFECLDDKHNKIYVDGFTDNLPKNERLIVPDYIFFGRDENVDLSDDYGDTSPQFKQASVKGLINILKTYNFTVEENTPAEIEVALDPELLGKVFENLLASFNPETKTTARKQTGSFYTPREIVNYMVDESLIAYFKGKTEIEEEKIRTLFQYTDEEHNLTSSQVEELVNALYECKILDPACGSGAFPMGILQKLVHILQKADPDNKNWEKVQKEKAEIELQRALDIDDKKDRENRLMEISNAFDVTKNTPDYARKLYLIENCIYGVDIQPIATQISKLRFFISLVVDQRNNTNDENFGIIPLPNLETKFVTANTLIGINRPTGQLSLSNTDEIKKLQEELRVCRHKIFSAKTKKTKQKYRQLDKEKRLAIANELKENGWNNTDADNLAGWDPYNQNASSPFFDPEWMFGLQRENGGLNSAGEGGFFDVVIANPPYIRRTSIAENMKRLYEMFYKSAFKQYDVYLLFIEKGLNLLKNKGILVYINPIRFFNSDYGFQCRKLIVENYFLHSVIDVSQISVFENAMTYPCILTIGNNTKSKNHIAEYLKINSISDFNRIDTSKKIKISQETIKNDAFYRIIFAEDFSTKIIRKVNQKSKRIEELFNIARGLPNNKVDFQNEKYLALKSTNVKKYSVVGDVIKVDIEHPEKFYKEMIVFPRTVFFLQATIKNKKVIVLDRIYYLMEKTSISKKFILGVINSKITNYWFEYYYSTTKVSGNYFDLNGNQIKSIPILDVSITQQQPIITLVNQILEAKQANPHANTSDLEREIDQLVYELYGLTQEEIDIIEGN